MSIHEVFPYLRAKSAEEAVQFYKTAFGATEKFRLTEPGHPGRPAGRRQVVPAAPVAGQPAWAASRAWE